MSVQIEKNRIYSGIYRSKKRLFIVFSITESYDDTPNTKLVRVWDFLSNGYRNFYVHKICNLKEIQDWKSVSISSLPFNYSGKIKTDYQYDGYNVYIVGDTIYAISPQLETELTITISRNGFPDIVLENVRSEDCNLNGINSESSFTIHYLTENDFNKLKDRLNDAEIPF